MSLYPLNFWVLARQKLLSLNSSQTLERDAKNSILYKKVSWVYLETWTYLVWLFIWSLRACLRAFSSGLSAYLTSKGKLVKSRRPELGTCPLRAMIAWLALATLSIRTKAPAPLTSSPLWRILHSWTVPWGLKRSWSSWKQEHLLNPNFHLIFLLRILDILCYLKARNVPVMVRRDLSGTEDLQRSDGQMQRSQTVLRC